MSDPLAKLITLTARQTQNVGGTDKLVLGGNGIKLEGPFTMKTGDEFGFDDQELIPFQAQVPLQLDLIAEHPGQGPANLGAVTILAEQQGHGEQTQQFQGSGAVYDLTYKVI
jgi:hypothetical protein